jgi:hypothetical protein
MPIRRLGDACYSRARFSVVYEYENEYCCRTVVGRTLGRVEWLAMRHGQWHGDELILMLGGRCTSFEEAPGNPRER